MPLLRPCLAPGSALRMLRPYSPRLPRLPACRSGDALRRCLATKHNVDAEPPSPPQSPPTLPLSPAFDAARVRYIRGVVRLRKSYDLLSTLSNHDERPALRALATELSGYLEHVTREAFREKDGKVLQSVGQKWRRAAKGGKVEHIHRDSSGKAKGESGREKSQTSTSDQQTPSSFTSYQQTSPSSTSEQQPPPSSAPKSSQTSLLEELFPDVKPYIDSPQTTKTYPKLDLPTPQSNVRVVPTLPRKSGKERMVEAFVKKGEHTTALQLVNCSTELTEADFRRMIPRGKHMDSWFRDGEFTKVIPGRDPLSLERLPFYYLLFKTPEAALAYQKNVSRLHKLSGLHQKSDILSAISLPKGFLEDGEDLTTAVSSYYLVPTNHVLRLSTVMQPYNPMLRSLVELGGYKPIVPNVDANGARVHKVLLYIEGYEPSTDDLWHIFARHARDHGITWPFRHDDSSAILRLRDIINLKTKLQAVSTTNPRASEASTDRDKVDFEDAAISMHYSSSDSDATPTQINQMIMNRMYNRWVIEFEEEDAARRFATMWHRKVLPDPVKNSRNTAWRETEERRICNAEYLW